MSSSQDLINNVSVCIWIKGTKGRKAQTTLNHKAHQQEPGSWEGPERHRGQDRSWAGGRKLVKVTQLLKQYSYFERLKFQRTKEAQSFGKSKSLYIYMFHKYRGQMKKKSWAVFWITHTESLHHLEFCNVSLASLFQLVHQASENQGLRTHILSFFIWTWKLCIMSPKLCTWATLLLCTVHTQKPNPQMIGFGVKSWK